MLFIKNIEFKYNKTKNIIRQKKETQFESPFIYKLTTLILLALSLFFHLKPHRPQYLGLHDLTKRRYHHQLHRQ